MAEIIGVKFKESGKLYYFQPNDEYLLTGTKVIVETSRGTECGEVVMERRAVPDEQITHELKKVLRAATADDLRRIEDNKAKEITAFGICEEKILKHKLDMKLVSVEYAFDGSKILFNFTADGRVDFRELVKDLASVFHTRIELRQIGVRDEAKMLGGLGICGRPFCCSSFLGDFIPVSIKMAKEQGLSLNPVKISGACGRLMCCLKYEEEAYQDLIKHTPRTGMHVNTPEGKGTVVEVNLITGNLRITMDEMPEAAPRTFNKKQVSSLGDADSMTEAEAAMFSSYQEPITDEERIELELMLEDDGIAPDEKAPSGGRGASQRQNRDRSGRRDQNRQRKNGGDNNSQKNGRGQQGRGNQGGGSGKNGQPRSDRAQQPRDGQNGGGQNKAAKSEQNRPKQNNGTGSRGGAPAGGNKSEPNGSRQNGAAQNRPPQPGGPQQGKPAQTPVHKDSRPGHPQSKNGGGNGKSGNYRGKNGQSGQNRNNHGRYGQSNRQSSGGSQGQHAQNRSGGQAHSDK